jgi:hypothetical protein
MFGRFRNFTADARWGAKSGDANFYIKYNHARGTYAGAPPRRCVGTGGWVPDGVR